MQKHLFQFINLKDDHVHIPDGETGDLEEECQRYERLLAKEGPIDLQILGLGINGHIGFNEPGTAFDARTHVVNLTDSTREANAKFFDTKEEVPKQAITMGIGNIMESREIILLAFGEHKQPAIKQLMEGEVYEDFPASALLQHDRVSDLWREGQLNLRKLS